MAVDFDLCIGISFDGPNNLSLVHLEWRDARQIEQINRNDERTPEVRLGERGDKNDRSDEQQSRILDGALLQPE